MKGSAAAGGTGPPNEVDGWRRVDRLRWAAGQTYSGTMEWADKMARQMGLEEAPANPADRRRAEQGMATVQACYGPPADDTVTETLIGLN